MIKKIIAVLLAASALISASGCLAKKDGNQAETTIAGQNADEQNPDNAAPAAADENFSSADTQEQTTDPEAEARKRDADIYKKFLRNGELSSRTKNMNRYYVNVSYCLIDLNDDDVHELVLKLTNTKESGARGYATESILYTIVNEEPTAIANVSYNGNSGGGDVFDIRYDTKSNKHVLITDGEKRDGTGAGRNYVIIHSLKGATLANQTHISSNYLNADYDVYSDKAEKIKAATPLCTQKNDTLYYWVINNKYVSEEDCDSAFANLVAPTDGKYQYKKGTFSNPIKE